MTAAAFPAFTPEQLAAVKQAVYDMSIGAVLMDGETELTTDGIDEAEVRAHASRTVWWLANRSQIEAAS